MHAACGILWSFGLFFLARRIIAFDGAPHEVVMIGRLYCGYNISPIGSVFGVVYGFVDALVGGAIMAWGSTSPSLDVTGKISRGQYETRLFH